MKIEPMRPPGEPGAAQPEFADLDIIALDGLVAAVGEENVPMLLSAFLDDLARLQRDAEAAVAGGNTAVFMATMHSLRGTCAYFGAARLGAIASHYLYASRSDLDAAWSLLPPAMALTVAATTALTEQFHDA